MKNQISGEKYPIARIDATADGTTDAVYIYRTIADLPSCSSGSIQRAGSAGGRNQTSGWPGTYSLIGISESGFVKMLDGYQMTAYIRSLPCGKPCGR